MKSLGSVESTNTAAEQPGANPQEMTDSLQSGRISMIYDVIILQ